ncbi:50S ribosome-binding GTPase [Candidatus Pacearchaeota archaeon]|nr:50S ribosome-binding GTPase [Candidatus Pacearchaeota archaeon]
MASTNQSPQYQKAELKFLNAKTDVERVACLEEMIRECPKHKSSEKMLANLKTRYNKLIEKIERNKKVSKSRGGKIGIKKEDMQTVIVGFANSGKSSLMSLLTNAKTEISNYEFTTKTPIVGMMNVRGVPIQIIEIPAIESEYYDKGIVNTTDAILILISSIDEIEKIRKILGNSVGKQIIVFNKSDLLNENEKRKISASLQSKKYNFAMISTKTNEGVESLKEKIFRCLDKIRIYTKQPGKEKSAKPYVMEKESTVKDVSEKILHGFSSRIKETKIWGPSSKFPGQKVGLNHELKDLDVVEFKTK